MLLKYTPDEARILKSSGQLPESTKLNEADEEDVGGVEFSNFLIHQTCLIFKNLSVDSGDQFNNGDEVAAQDRNFSLSESSAEDESEEEQQEDDDEEPENKAQKVKK